MLKEARRVLRPGGVLYIDLEPNRSFWQALGQLERDGAEGLDEVVMREIRAVHHIEEDVHEQFGIEPDVFRAAEYMNLGGFEAKAFERDAVEAGFGSCETTFEWFLGQGALMHSVSFEAADATADHLRRLLPVSAHLFKYLRFEATA